MGPGPGRAPPKVVLPRFQVGTRDDAAYPPTKQFFAGPDARTVDEWIDDLNAFLREGLADHLARPEWQADGSRGGECLMALQNRCAVWGRSPVSNCYADGGNVDSAPAAARRRAIWDRVATGAFDARAFEASTKYTSDAADPDVHDWLVASGVSRVVVGHKPVGDSPAVLRATTHTVEVVMGDTSFADTAAPDRRGKSLAVLSFVGSALDDTQTVAAGARADGSRYTARLDDGTIGTKDDTGWWCKARLDDTGDLLLSKGDGRRVEYRLIAARS